MHGDWCESRDPDDWPDPDHADFDWMDEPREKGQRVESVKRKRILVDAATRGRQTEPE